MFLFADIYLNRVESTRVVNFHGQVGSYKTLSAIATAYALLRTGRYKRVYSNTPCTFASSPPKNIDRFDFLNREYASDSIFVLDENGVFLKGTTQEQKEIFAFPRHRNQVFLLASVIATPSIRSYCNLFVTRDFNFSMLGLPLMSFRSGDWGQDKPPKHWILFYSRYFSKYASKFDPVGIEPIKQWRDSGTLYDMQSREINPVIAKYYDLTTWGLAERKTKLTDDEQREANLYIPHFDTDYIFHEEIDLPKPKKKRSLSNPLGTEFNLGIFLQIIGLVYLVLCFATYFGSMKGNAEDKKLQDWGSADVGNFFMRRPIVQVKEPQATATPYSQVEFTIEDE